MSGPAAESASLSDLEQEGDVAADYLEGLLDILDLGGDLALDVRHGRAHVSVEADDDQTLAALADPETVAALQELTRLAVHTRTGHFSRLILDVGHSREARRRELEALVAAAATRIADGAGQASLPPMSSYERKLVHDIAAERGLESESFGDGPQRHTVLRAR